MPRPRRLYKEKDSGKYYYIIDGGKKYVTVPAGISSSNLSKINIKNIINLASTKRRKPGAKRQPKFQKKIISGLEKTEQGGLPLYLFKSQRKFATLDEIAKNSDDTSVDKLSKLLLKGITATPSSSKIAPTIAMMTQTAPMTSEAGVQTSAKVTTKPKRKLGEPFVPTGMESKEDERKGESKEAEPRSKATLVKSNAVVKIMEQMARNNESLDYDNVRAYIKKYHQGEVGFQKNIGRAKYDDALEAYNILNPVQQTSVTTSNLMPPPPPRPTRKITTLSDILSPTTAYETSSEMGNYVRGLMKQGGVRGTQTETETEVEGAGYDGDGLYNDEIEKIAKKRIKDYVPVIASDQLDELPKYVARGDKRFGFVINTNPSTSDGSGNDGMRPGHWRAVFINNEDDYPSIEYFDPLAEGKMPEDLIKMCRRIAVKMNPEVMFKYKQNMLRRQSKLTSNCGWHCVKFLDDRYNGIPYSESSGYDAYMEGLNNTPDASRDGEKEIASYIKKYESYI
jgi:hypothetical protein